MGTYIQFVGDARNAYLCFYSWSCFAAESVLYAGIAVNETEIRTLIESISVYLKEYEINKIHFTLTQPKKT